MAMSHDSFVSLAFFMILFVTISTGFDLNWYNAHATFYGDIRGAATMKGACGYGNLFQQGYGLATTALSSALFNHGLSCGACFEIRCVNDPQWCRRDGPGSIKVTATNWCPPNYAKPTGNWCNPPLRHFDLSLKMFLAIAYYRAGIVPVQYRRVPCIKSGGVRFQIGGNPYWLRILVFNVANAGDVHRVLIKGSRTNWLTMSRSWGQNWVTGVRLVGQPLTFYVTTSDGKSLEFINVIPSNWQFGQTYQGRFNF